MQLVSSPINQHKEGDMAPVAAEVLMCTQLEEEKEVKEEEKEKGSRHPHHLLHHAIPSATPTYDIPGNTRKRKSEEERDEEEEDRERGKMMREMEEEGRRRKEIEERVGQYLQQRRRLLASQRKLAVQAGQTQVIKLPLCYVYSDLLRLLPAKLNNMGWGAQGRGRRKSPVQDLSTPIDSSHHPLEASSHVSQSKTPPLYHVTDSVDSQSLEEGGFSQEWFARVLQLVMEDLNKYGVCVVDDFLGTERADRILAEVKDLHSLGVFQAGQVVSRQVQDPARGKIRGDKIAWVTGSEPNCSAIGQLVSVVDSLVAKANKHQDAGKLAQYNITWRTRAMVACYPGRDTHYVKHVDNPNGDGRCITAIYYLNKNWTAEDGGVLRIYPENSSDIIAAIEPCFDRMLFFWSDRRNPHEVMPAKMTRFAITVWYLDQKEREEYLAREAMRAAACT